MAVTLLLEPTDAKDFNLHTDIIDGELYEVEMKLTPIARVEQTKLFKKDGEPASDGA